jgi:exodeoxyribonuclease X
MLNEASAEQLIAWSREPGLLPRVPAGSERGKPFRDLGTDALRVLARDRDIDVRFSAETELRQRDELAPLPARTPKQQSLL